MSGVTMEKVNIDKLEREMVSALEADRRYTRENDAKFRAINQRVQSYEEFRYLGALYNRSLASQHPLYRTERDGGWLTRLVLILNST